MTYENVSGEPLPPALEIKNTDFQNLPAILETKKASLKILGCGLWLPSPGKPPPTCPVFGKLAQPPKFLRNLGSQVTQGLGAYYKGRLDVAFYGVDMDGNYKH